MVVNFSYFITTVIISTKIMTDLAILFCEQVCQVLLRSCIVLMTNDNYFFVSA